MMKAIWQRSSYLLGSQLFLKGITFIYTLFLARSLGLMHFGIYIFALSYFAVLSALSDFGISRFLMKEIALEKTNLPVLMTTTIALRSLTILIALAICSIFLLADPSDHLRQIATMVALLAVLPQALTMTLDALFISRSKTHLTAMGSIIGTVVTVGVGGVLVIMQFGVQGAVIGLIAGQIANAIALLLLSGERELFLLANVSSTLLRRTFTGAIPYGLLGILGLLYFRIDSLLLGYLRGNVEVGIYGAAYRFLEVCVLIPSAFSVTVFPLLTRMHLLQPTQISKMPWQIVRWVLPVGLGVMGIYYLIIPWLIAVLLPNYIGSIEVIKVLSLAIPFIFLHVSLAQVLLSSDRFLKKILVVSFIPLAFNIISNLIFIPVYGYIAAAWITVFSDIVSLGILLPFLRPMVLQS